MKVRDLERLICQHGVTPAKVDAVTRRLRESGRLPMGGRGVNAPDISSREAAQILIALAGSSKGIEADVRLEKLESMRSTSMPRRAFLDAMEEVLGHPTAAAGLAQIRIARTIRSALFVFTNGQEEVFQSARPQDYSDRFWVEGILSGSLLTRIGAALRGTLGSLDDASDGEG